MATVRLDTEQDLELGPRTSLAHSLEIHPHMPTFRQPSDGRHSLPAYTCKGSLDDLDNWSSDHNSDMENEAPAWPVLPQRPPPFAPEDIYSEDFWYQRTISYIMQQDPNEGADHPPEEPVDPGYHSISPLSDITARAFGYRYPYGVFVSTSPSGEQFCSGYGTSVTADQGVEINGCTYYDQALYPSFVAQPFIEYPAPYFGGHGHSWSDPTAYYAYSQPFPEHIEHGPMQRAQSAHQEMQRGLQEMDLNTEIVTNPSSEYKNRRNSDLQTRRAERDLDSKGEQRRTSIWKHYSPRPRLQIRTKGL